LISKRIASIKDFMNPMAPGWHQQQVETVKMMPTPMAMQPTAYIRNSRAGMPHGQTGQIEVSSVHDGETLAVNLSWEGVSPKGGDFPDAIAVAFPLKGNPVLIMMGSKTDPIHILHWKAGKGVKSIVAQGIGLSEKGPEFRIASEAVEDGNRWRVVISRILGTGGGIAPVTPGVDTKIGFALWSGANDERAGLKAFSIDWIPFAVEA
jgi:DMSO reductase family type II enzyme heme b subunit